MRIGAALTLALAVGCGETTTEEQVIDIQWGKDDSSTMGMLTLDEHSPRATGSVTCNREPGCHLVFFVPISEGDAAEGDGTQHEVAVIDIADVALPLAVNVREVQDVAPGAQIGPEPHDPTASYLNYIVPELRYGPTPVTIEKTAGAGALRVVIRADFANGCTTDSHCRFGEACVSGSCVQSCDGGGACDAGSECIDGACLAIDTCEADLACPPDAHCDRDAGRCTIF